jgi:hypothetical protein
MKTIDVDSFPLFGRQRVAHAARTSDEWLESMNSGQTISRGTYWDGAGVNPKLDEKVAPIRNFVSGFIPGNVVGAESPGTVINRGRSYLSQVQDEQVRAGLRRALDEAEEEWRKDKRYSPAQARDDAAAIAAEAAAHLRGATQDGRAMTPLPRYQPGTARGISTPDYAENLKKGREAMARA